MLRASIHHALDNVRDAMAQTVQALSESDDPDMLADLSRRLDALDDGAGVLIDLLTDCMPAATI